MLEFYTLINHTQGVISLAISDGSIPTISAMDVDQIKQLGNLVLNIQSQMQQHLTNFGIASYPLKTILSLRYSLKQIADFHENRLEFCLSTLRLPCLPIEDRPDWAKKALSHLQARVECDQHISQVQVSLNYLKRLGLVEHVWPLIIK